MSKDSECLSGRISRSDELLALAARCAREDRSMRLDCAISKVITGEEIPSLFYTGSLDAAVTLMHSDWYWQLENGEPAIAFCRLFADDPNKEHSAAAKTPALALCAAALRAKAAIAENVQASERTSKGTPNPPPKEK